MAGLVPMATGVGFDFIHMEPILRTETAMMWKPLAWALFFGLLFNTLLTLVGVPVYYYTWERIKERFGHKGGPFDSSKREVPPGERTLEPVSTLN